MGFTDWILPTLIGFVASIMLISILYNDPYVKNKFADLGSLIQLQTSRPAYHVNLVPVPLNNYQPNLQPNLQNNLQPLNTIDNIIYNYYPKININNLSNL